MVVNFITITFIGKDYAVFEPVHGSAPDIAGQNKANPTAMLMSAIEMLNYIDEREAGARIKSALLQKEVRLCLQRRPSLSSVLLLPLCLRCLISAAFTHIRYTIFSRLTGL